VDRDKVYWIDSVGILREFAGKAIVMIFEYSKQGSLDLDFDKELDCGWLDKCLLFGMI
jgi:hypothetical protein